MEGCGAGVLFLGVDDDFELLLPPPQGTASQNQDHEPGRTIEGVYKEDEEEEEVDYGAMHHDDDEDDGDSLVDDSSSSRMRSLPQPSSPVPPPQPALPAEYSWLWRRIAALRLARVVDSVGEVWSYDNNHNDNRGEDEGESETEHERAVLRLVEELTGGRSGYLQDLLLLARDEAGDAAKES